MRHETSTRPEISEEPYSSSLHNGKKRYNFAFINRPMLVIFYEKRHLMCKVPYFGGTLPLVEILLRALHIH